MTLSEIMTGEKNYLYPIPVKQQYLNIDHP
jgi:hypothetical protein